VNQDKFFIGGDWVDPAGSDQLAVISPHTEEVIAKVPKPPPPTSTERSRPPATRSTTARGRR